MTPEQQRIAIHRARGFELREVEEMAMHWPGGMLPAKVQRWCSKNDPISIWHSEKEVPDYLNDLNAMHEAERYLLSVDADDNPRTRYVEELKKLTEWDDCRWPLFKLVSATAEQRAEAFLRTLNLWVDE